MYVNLFLKRKKGEKGVILRNKFSTPLVFNKPHKIGVLAVSLSSRKVHNSPVERGFIISAVDGSAPEVYLFTRKHWAYLKEVAAELRKLISESAFGINIAVHEKNLRWTLPANTEIRFSHELSDYLGITDGKITAPQAKTVYSTPDLKSGFSRIYLQSKDILPLQHYRDRLAPILDSFDYTFEHDLISRRFPSPIYHYLSQKRLEELTIYLTDEFGRLLGMDDGHAWVLVHIKACQEESLD